MENRFILECCLVNCKPVFCAHSLSYANILTVSDANINQYLNTYEQNTCSTAHMLVLKTIQHLQHKDSLECIENLLKCERIFSKQSFYRFIKDYAGSELSRKQIYSILPDLPKYTINEQLFSVHDFIDCFALKKEPYYILNGTFLDNFYRLESTKDREKLMPLEPANYLSVHQSNYAYIAAMVEKLSNDFNLKPPEWIYKSMYYMSKPFYPDKRYGYSNIIDMEESPIEYKSRNITASKNCLTRL